MNRHHAKVTDWGLRQLAIERDYKILDVGCGGGRTVHELAAIATEGKIWGIDHSQESVNFSQQTNREWIEQGRVEIRRASVSALPFPDQMFDLVTAIETHFFWPDLVSDMREVLRVLKPGGKLAIIAESYKGAKHEKVMQKLTDFMQIPYHSMDDYRDLFTRAGYSDMEIYPNNAKGWICAIGRKPPQSPAGHPAAGQMVN